MKITDEKETIEENLKHILKAKVEYEKRNLKMMEIDENKGQELKQKEKYEIRDEKYERGNSII